MSRDLKSEIISFIQRYTRDYGKPPTVKTLCDKISGVNRSNFYKIFPEGIGDACTIAGVEVPEKRILSTAKAIKSRRSQEFTLPQLVLSSEDTGTIQTIAYIENVTPQEIIHKLIENDRILRRQFGLSINDLSRLASFLRNCENKGVTWNRIIDSLLKFTNFRFDILPAENYNLLIRLWSDMLSNNWTFEHIMWLYQEKQKIYRHGYARCMGLVPSTIVDQITKSYEFRSISIDSASWLGNKVALSLGLSELSYKM